MAIADACVAIDVAVVNSVDDSAMVEAGAVDAGGVIIDVTDVIVDVDKTVVIAVCVVVVAAAEKHVFR